MSYGQAEKPCDNFKHWYGNGTLCGRCAHSRTDHDNLPVIKEIVFALIFDGKVVGYKKWYQETCQWVYSETYNDHSLWSYEPIKLAYSQIELVKIWPGEIEREKGEREDGFLKALDEKIAGYETAHSEVDGYEAKAFWQGKVLSSKSIRDLYTSTLTKK